jgi:hypothetical protein
MIKYYYSPTSRLASALLKALKRTLPLLIALLSISSCEEEPTTLGKGLLPGSDFVTVKSFDTLSVRSYTMYDSLVRTDNPTISYLGSLYDPFFGLTTASFASQLRLKYDWTGKPFVVDSVKLILAVNVVKGNTDGINKLSFYELPNQIFADSAYNSTVLNSNTVYKYKVTDLVLPSLRADTLNNIEIKVPTDFGKYLMRDTSMLVHANNKPDFRSFFKGLYFELSSSDPILLSLSLVNKNSSSTGYFIFDRTYENFFVLYFHDLDGNKNTYYFILDAVNKNAAFNKYSHNFNVAQSGNINQVVNKHISDSVTYIQGLNGAYTGLEIPGLEKLKSDPDFKNIAVNKARLTIPFYLDTVNYQKSSAPSMLYLRYKTKSGKKYSVPDFNPNQSLATFFDGRVDTVKMVYNFNIPSFVQKYLDDASGEILPELEIVESLGGTKNVILESRNSKRPIKLNFAYTIFQ